jgi:ATP-dependent DNA helicase RecG
VQAGRKKSLKLLSVLADEELIGQAREEAAAVLAADPALAGQPVLAAAIEELFGAERVEYLEKA